MVKLMRRWWKYLTAKLTGQFEAAADPKIQLEQAIAEAREQHERLTQQAANVIANQKQTEARLKRAQDEIADVTAKARQALLLADQATTSGDPKAADYQKAAETFANRLIALEKEAEGLNTLLIDAARNSDAAKAAVQQNSMRLQKQLSEKQKLLSQLDQAKMQEEMNKAVAQLNATVGEDVPTVEEIREKIETRAAKAQGMAELQGNSVEGTVLEVEHAAMNAEAQARLAQLRDQLGLPGAATAPGTSAPATAPAEGETPAG